MKKLNIEFQELPYAVEEAMNRLRINIKFCGKKDTHNQQHAK